MTTCISRTHTTPASQAVILVQFVNYMSRRYVPSGHGKLRTLPRIIPAGWGLDTTPATVLVRACASRCVCLNTCAKCVCVCVHVYVQASPPPRSSLWSQDLCVCVCVCVCDVFACASVCVCVCVCDVFACASVCVCACVHHQCIFQRIWFHSVGGHTRTHMHRRVDAYAHTHTHAHTATHTQTNRQTDRHTDTHTHTYTHIHTHTESDL